MSRIIRGLLLAMLCWPALGAHAQVSPAVAESLVRKSGLWEQLDGFAPQVRQSFVSGMQQSGVSVAPAEMARVQAAIDTAYDVRTLRAVGVSTIAAGLDPRHVTALQQWYDSPTGKAVTRLEEASSAGDIDPQAYLREGQAMLASMPEKRRALLHELLVVTRSAEGLVDMVINAAVGAHAGIVSVVPGQQHSPDDLRALLEAQRPQLIQAYSAVSMAGFAKVYAPLPDDQLARYVDFLRTDAGRHFTEVGMSGLQKAMTDATTGFWRAVAARPPAGE